MLWTMSWRGGGCWNLSSAFLLQANFSDACLQIIENFHCRSDRKQSAQHRWGRAVRHYGEAKVIWYRHMAYLGLGFPFYCTGLWSLSQWLVSLSVLDRWEDCTLQGKHPPGHVAECTAWLSSHLQSLLGAQATLVFSSVSRPHHTPAHLGAFAVSLPLLIVLSLLASFPILKTGPPINFSVP